jgi:hypothetical protein
MVAAFITLPMLNVLLILSDSRERSSLAVSVIVVTANERNRRSQT